MRALAYSFLQSIIFLVASILFSAQAFCSPPDSLEAAYNKRGTKIDLYHVNYPIVASITGIGLFSDYFAINRIKGKPGITDAELSNLNTDIINPIDQWGLRQDASQRQYFSRLSDYLETPMIFMPGLLVFNKNIRKEWGDLLMMYVEGHTVTFTFYNYSWLGPTFNNKYRPLTYYTELSAQERKSGNNRNSFYSGHTATLAFSTFFMAKVYCDYHPEMGKGKKFLVYTAAFVPAALEGYFRVRSLAHFPSDNMTGLVLGAALGIIIPEMHKYHNKNISLGMFSPPGGMGLTVCWNLK